ncbi:MAG TPA: HlyC/CorC family transporter [Flammeovirgaceae bacterium]|nr:HlyC/CorC family transporter [Flammeovirgaceae bacterium]
MTETLDIYIILITLLFSAFFSGMEIAFVSTNKLQIEIQARKNDLIGRILSGFVHHQDKFLSTTLIGNNLALVIYGIFMARLLVPVLDNITPPAINTPVVLLLEQTLLATLVVLVTAEFLPKSLFIINPNRMLRLLAVPMQIIYYLLYLPTLVITGLSRWVITGLLKQQYDNTRPVYGLTDLNNYIKRLAKAAPAQSEHDPETVPDIDEQIFANVLQFKKVRVRDCMIPRTEITAIDINEATIDDLRQAFTESGHSKVIVYKDTIDNVLGYCYALQMFKKPAKVEDVLNDIMLVPETMYAYDLMMKFISSNKSLAVVVDEYGGTSGLVSIEDIIEEITGEIEDEHDTGVLLEKQVSANCYHLSARLEIDYLNEQYAWQLPTGEYDTLGGLILFRTGSIPEQGEAISFDHFHIRILSIADNRINTVELCLDESPQG